MDAWAAVAQRYEAISGQLDGSGRPSGLSYADRALWYVVAVRCERDMEGLESVFDQLLDEAALRFFIRVLTELREPALAALFERAHRALAAVGFYDRPHAMCHEFGDGLIETLDEIDVALADDALWQLDPKLMQLCAGTALR